MGYIRPTSVTWWGGIALIALGITQVLQGDVEVGLKAIATGITAIGIRNAVGGGVDPTGKG